MVLYLIQLTLFVGLTVYLAIIPSWYAVLPAFGVLWSGYKVVNLFKRLHEKISYFFNAVENEDSTLYFPENIRQRPVRELNQSLNRMNRLIQEVKLRNREQEQYYSLLLEQVSTGIIVTDEKGNIHLANSSAERLFDYFSLRHIEQLKRLDAGLYE
ncbi:MAG: PAS domain S-box protein, partial [Bacteroidales bacterium]|nr:PAS domain S-box protein [Bacteroidales bacterium]